KYWDVRITKCFPMCLIAGKKFTAVPLREKHCEPMKTAGIVQAAPRGFVGRFVLGRRPWGMSAEFSSLPRTLPVASSRMRRYAPPRNDCDWHSRPLTLELLNGIFGRELIRGHRKWSQCTVCRRVAFAEHTQIS